ncbi:hypothetical protein TNCV_827251 [Trichonephila clavipes]|nr:hypothetical protein TNCV_827251 [Trichonephila clavipes]
MMYLWVQCLLPGVGTRHPFRWGKRRTQQIPFVVNNNRADIKITVTIPRDRRPPISCLKAYGPTNLEQPTLNHVQSNTMASAVLADPTRALQGKNRGSGPDMEESENDVGSLEQLTLAVCGRALSFWKIAPGRPFRKGPTWDRRISST